MHRFCSPSPADLVEAPAGLLDKVLTFFEGSGSNVEAEDSAEAPALAPPQPQWKRSALTTSALRSKGQRSVKVAGEGSQASNAASLSSASTSTLDHLEEGSEVSKGPQRVECPTVKLHIEAKDLKGGVGAFRDAHVEFRERQLVVRAFDFSGKCWTLRSATLPGPIITTESRYQVSKTGKDLSITLKKANATEIWEGKIKLSELGQAHSNVEEETSKNEELQSPAAKATQRDSPSLGSTFI